MWFLWTPESEQNIPNFGVENENFLWFLFVHSILFLFFKW